MSYIKRIDMDKVQAEYDEYDKARRACADRILETSSLEQMIREVYRCNYYQVICNILKKVMDGEFAPDDDVVKE